MSCLGYHVELVVRDFIEIVNKYEIFANEYDDVTAVKQPIKLQCECFLIKGSRTTFKTLQRFVIVKEC